MPIWIVERIIWGLNFSHACISPIIIHALILSNQLLKLGFVILINPVEFQHQSDTTFHVFKDYDYHCQLFNGMSWSDICKDIVQTLPQHVFISMDIDELLVIIVS